MACYNPLLAAERARKRIDLLEVTEGELGRIRAEVERRTNTLLTAKEIALKVGRKINKWKMAKHFRLTIQDGKLQWSRKAEAIRREEELDGIYIIRPIRHRLTARVRAHIFLCMLTYYVEWHMRKALAPLLYHDEELEQLRANRDPVAKAEPSQSAKRKKARR